MYQIYVEAVNLFKTLFQLETPINELTESQVKILFEISKRHYPEMANLIDFFIKGQNANKLDSKLVIKRYANHKQYQNSESQKLVIDKSFWLSLIGLVRPYMQISKEPIYWRQFVTRYLTKSNLNIVSFLSCAYLDIDITETNNAKFLQDLSSELTHILIEWSKNPNDTEKFKNELESLPDRFPDFLNKELVEKALEGFFMKDGSFEQNFFIYIRCFCSTFNSNLSDSFEFLFKFDQDNFQHIKAAKQKLQGIENNYDHVEIFVDTVQDYGEQVKQIQHKTNLYTKQFDETRKTDMLSSINEDVNNFRIKKRMLSTDINSTLRDLMKTKALLIEHRFRMRTMKSLSFLNIFTALFLNSLNENQKKIERIDVQFVANLTERSSEVVESIAKDLGEIVEQKSKVLDKIELVEKIKTDYKRWHQIEKACFEKLG